MEIKIKLEDVVFMKEELKNRFLDQPLCYYEIGRKEYINEYINCLILLLNFDYDHESDLSLIHSEKLFTIVNSSMNHLSSIILNKADNNEFWRGIKSIEEECLELLVFSHGRKSFKPAA